MIGWISQIIFIPFFFLLSRTNLFPFARLQFWLRLKFGLPQISDWLAVVVVVTTVPMMSMMSVIGDHLPVAVEFFLVAVVVGGPMVIVCAFFGCYVELMALFLVLGKLLKLLLNKWTYICKRFSIKAIDLLVPKYKSLLLMRVTFCFWKSLVMIWFKFKHFTWHRCTKHTCCCITSAWITVISLLEPFGHIKNAFWFRWSLS